MAISYLAIKNRTATTIVYRMRACTTPTQVGNNLPSTADETTTGQTKHTSGKRVIHFKGRIYAISNDGVYKLQGDNSWSKSPTDGGFTFTSPSTTTENCVRAGFEVVNRNNRPYLYGAYKTAVGGMRAFWLDPHTDVWVLGAEGGVSVIWNTTTGHGGFKRQVAFHDQIYYIANIANSSTPTWSPVKYDPATDTWTFPVRPSDSVQTTIGQDFCVYNDELWLLYVGATNTLRLAKYDLAINTFTSTVLLNSGTSWLTNATHGNCLYTDGTYLFASALINNSTFATYRIDSINTVVAVNGMLPFILQPASSLSLNNDDVLSKLTDVESSPGSSRVLLAHRDGTTLANSITIFQVVSSDGSAAALSVGSGGAIHYAIPEGFTSGDNFFVVGEPDILITWAAPDIISEVIQFKAFGGGLKTARFYYALQGESVVLGQLLLRGAASGGTAVRNGNQVDNVLADGVTTYSIQVDPLNLGISTLTRFQILPRLSTS